MHHIRFRLGLCPRPCWGSLQRSPRPASWIKGGLFLREGRERVGKRGRGGRRGEGRERGRGSFSVHPTFPPKSMPLPSVPPPLHSPPQTPPRSARNPVLESSAFDPAPLHINSGYPTASESVAQSYRVSRLPFRLSVSQRFLILRYLKSDSNHFHHIGPYMAVSTLGPDFSHTAMHYEL